MADLDFDSIFEGAEEETTVTAETETATTETEPTPPVAEKDTTPDGDTVQPTTAEQSKATAKEAEPEQTITVQFNHETKQIPISQAAEFIQKGLAYDSEGVADDREWIREQAKRSGFNSTKEYRESLNKVLDANEARKVAEERNIPEEVAQELVESKNALQRERERRESETAEQKQREKTLGEIRSFARMFPDVDVSKLPAAVYKAKADEPDVPIVYHYSAYLATQQAQQAAVVEKQKQNAATATPPLNSNATDTSSEEDAVLKSIFK